MTFKATCWGFHPDQRHEPELFDNATVLGKHFKAEHPRRATRLEKPKSVHTGRFRGPKPGDGTFTPGFAEPGYDITWKQLVEDETDEHGHSWTERAGQVWAIAGPGLVWVVPYEPYENEVYVTLRVRRSGSRAGEVEFISAEHHTRVSALHATLEKLRKATHLVAETRMVSAGAVYRHSAARDTKLKQVVHHLPRCEQYAEVAGMDPYAVETSTVRPDRAIDFLLGRTTDDIVTKHPIPRSLDLCPVCLPVTDEEVR